MGFLDNLLKKETRRIISGVVDSVVDEVKDSILGNDAEVNAGTGNSAARNNISDRHRENETGDDSDCCWDKEVVQKRIEMIAAQDWPSYELRRNISAAELGGDANAHGFDYGLYLDGQPKVMIMILEQYQYRNKSVQEAHAVCRSRNIGSFHLLMYLPNRRTYIEDRIKAVMP